jgi:3,4-dihydroxy 2-butanone 4-phosphate synthase/GTP cyclohydrolase II
MNGYGSGEAKPLIDQEARSIGPTSASDAVEQAPGGLSSIEEVIADLQRGRMVIVVDDEDRENEGDFVLAAEKVTPEAINFMARHGRGLICLALTQDRVRALGLPLMPRHNVSRHQTAFTVSIEALEGITTGISAADRARTIAIAADPRRGADEITTPGHVFPLVARDGGVLVRAGHTEAAIDLARLAGLTPAGVICEIMNDDGTMARLPDLLQLAKVHRLKVCSIADLIAYRWRTERLVHRVLERDVETRHGGGFRMIIYRSAIDGVEHVALVKGDPSEGPPMPVRMHAVNLLDDVIGDLAYRRDGHLGSAMQRIEALGRGIVVLIRESEVSRPSKYVLERERQLHEACSNLRDYGTGAQILADLGVREMILLSNTVRSIVGLEGYGLRVIGYEPI